MTIYGRKITDDDMRNIASYMDDEIREELHSKSIRNSWSNEEFLTAYLERDPELREILENEFEFEEM